MLNTNGAILNFRNHLVSLPSGDIKTFDILTEWVFCSVGHKAQFKDLNTSLSHVAKTTPNSK